VRISITYSRREEEKKTALSAQAHLLSREEEKCLYETSMAHVTEKREILEREREREADCV